MKLASSFLFSLLLHSAVVVAYPVSFAVPPGERLIPVKILTYGKVGDGRGNGPSAAKSTTPPKSAKSSGPTAVTRPSQRLKAATLVAKEQHPAIKPAADVEEKQVPSFLKEPETSRVTTISTEDGTQGATQETADGKENSSTAGWGPEPAASGTGHGSGLGASGTGKGSGYGEGQGHGTGSAELQLTPVSFDHAPPPHYPAAARVDGEEGRVLLRVLVDEEGKSKKVEINRSSGSPILDQAAADAIKRWRFSPARYGDVPTASWVRIPVEFRLVDARN